MKPAVSYGPKFAIHKVATNGRLGEFAFHRPIRTPFLFPVAYLMTGTTARGGATWKYILQDQSEELKPHTLIRRNSPLLSQVLHFLDYKVSSSGVQNWREHSIKGLYNKQIPDLNFQAPLFLDSGGFKLMYRTGMDLSKYDISLKRGEESKSILQLQRDLGGDIVATLDYPLPPNLKPTEVKKRMHRSQKNAIQTALLLREDGDFNNYNPFLFMAVHGLTSDAISKYVKALFRQIEKNELGDLNFGLAIGSLVPLRISHNIDLIVKLVRATIKAIPEEYSNRIPIHIFGTTGLLVPYLAYLGIDSFDSSTFAQEARSLKYILPRTFHRRNILEMARQDIICDCVVCQHLKTGKNLHELQTSLVSEVVGKPQPSGYYKSKYYADVALHNFELDLGVLEKTRSAIQAEALDDYLIETARDVPRMADVLAVITTEDDRLMRKASRAIQPLPQPSVATQQTPTRLISLEHTPEDFNINSNGYRPVGNKPILLIIPCSREKPYSESHSHKYLSEKLEEALPDWQEKVDKVTLSGLYGPVPVACETQKPVMEYDFRLTTNNKSQIEECTNRLVEFLERHGKHYEQCIAYGTSNAYRTVFDKTAKQYSSLIVLPKNPKSRRLNEFFRIKNVSELNGCLLNALAISDQKDIKK